MNTLEYKFEIKKLDESGTFEGMAAVYGNVDHGNDVIMPGAFTKTLKDHDGIVPILYQHNNNMPIGKGTLTDTAKGLEIFGQLTMEVSKARESHALMKDDVLKGLSIGYSTVVSEYDSDKDIRYLKELRLWEVSLVTFPMNPKAKVTAVKDMTIDELIEAAKNKNLSADLMKQINELLALVKGQAAASAPAPDIHAMSKAENIIKILSKGV